MHNFLVSVLLLVLVGILGAAGAIYSGVFDVAATDPHSAPVRWVLEQVRVRSVKAHAAGIAEPADLGDPQKLVLGTSHYAAHCAVCHGAPGVPRGDIAQGLYPAPPDLAQAAARYSPAELFWILKHGIKMTGMPSWSDHGDDDLWATVAFIEKLPGMTEPDYAQLVMASMMAGGHHHHHDAAAEPPADAAETAGTVLALKGNCMAEPDKGAIALKVGDEVQIGETIATGDGAKLKLQMADGSTIAAGANSRITIQSYGKDGAGKRDVPLSLASGLLRAVVAPAEQPSRFEVITATGVAAVRSTDWVIEMTDETTIVGVLGGKVALTSRATREEVEIPEHWGSRVIGDKDPVKPRRWADEEFGDVISRTDLD